MLLFFACLGLIQKQADAPLDIAPVSVPVVTLDPKNELSPAENIKFVELPPTKIKIVYDPPQEAMPVNVPLVKNKKLGYSYGLQDVTPSGGNVRATTAKVGVDYKVTERASLGVETARTIHDSQDAAAWGESVKDENSAEVKYKLEF